MIALGPDAVTLLREHHAKQAAWTLAAGEAWNREGWVWTNEIGDPISPDYMSHRYAKFASAKGMPKGMRSLRHSMASLMLAANIHPKIVSERLGHSDVSLTLNTYSHAIPALQADPALRFEAVMGAQSEGAVANW
jgi:integrase